MSRWYGNRPLRSFSPSALKLIRTTQANLESRQFLIFQFVNTPEDESLPVAVEIADPPKVDWHSFVQFNPKPWDELAKNPFRCRAGLSDYYNSPFGDEGKYLSIAIYIPAEDRRIYGFADRSSPLGSQILRAIGGVDRPSANLILSLSSPPESFADDVAEIHAIVSESWILP